VSGPPRRIVVPPESAGARLDSFLVTALAARSRSAVQRLIESGAVLVGGRPGRASTRLDAGDEVEVSPAGAAQAAMPAREDGEDEARRADLSGRPDLPLELLHADRAILVVNKPPGQVVHPAAGHADDTLVNALLARFPDLDTAFEGRRPGIVHRLDKDTSGVMVVGRTQDAADALMRQFKARTVEKTYLALVKGLLRPAAGLIDAPIARDPRRRQRMTAAAGGRPAQTEYRVLASAGDYSWVELRPRTGRTHQIRVHLAALGHPVAGDRVYGRSDRLIGRVALHAWRLAFEHPTRGGRETFTAPLPADLRSALAALGLGGAEPAPPPDPAAERRPGPS
jgi:23S rRNA pseudouridine1911/1915/1917 synthase